MLAGLLVVVAGLGDAGVGGGWRARLHRRFLQCKLAGLLEVLGGLVAVYLLYVHGGGAAGVGRVIVHTAAQARCVLRS